MRIFAVSDIHLDHPENERWFNNLSHTDYQADILILAGDISDEMGKIAGCFTQLRKKFREVAFVPGNHDLWVHRSDEQCSLDKYQAIMQLTHDCGILTKPYYADGICIVPLLAWYDFAFGEPNEKLVASWMDFRACVWPATWDMNSVTEYFLAKNVLELQAKPSRVISFSHFLPRIDLLSGRIPEAFHYLHPIMGSPKLEVQIRALKSHTHIYGHSHINQHISIEGVSYINNAFGYPAEKYITQKALQCLHES